MLKFKKGCVRQGDVALVQVYGKLPDDWKKVQSPGEVVLAYGEVTGHSHKFGRMDRVSLYRPDDCGGGGAVLVDSPATLLHEEHHAKVVDAGLYLQAVQVEETPEAIRQVQD